MVGDPDWLKGGLDLFDRANTWLAPWAQKYDVVKHAPVIVLVTIAVGIVGLLWKLFVSGPTRRRREKEQTAAAKAHSTALDANAAASTQHHTATHAKVDEVLALLKSKAEPGAAFDATAEEGLRTTIANLLSAQEGARKRAGDKLAAGDRDGALTELKQFAAHENEAAVRAAETQKEIGVLAFPDRTQEAIDAFERAAQLAPADPEARTQLGHLYQRVGRLDEAKAAYQTILDAAGMDESWQAAALGNLGVVAHTRGDLDAAEDYHKRSLTMDEQLGRVEGQASSLGNLGLVAHTRGDLDAAEDYLKRSLAMNEKLGRLEGQANQLGNLGLVAQTRGDLDAARGYWRRSLALFRKVGLKPQVEQVSRWLRDIGNDPDAPAKP